MSRALTLAEARARYVHRFTMEHVPRWAQTPTPAGWFCAPQFRTDVEWYANTKFPGEPGWLGIGRDCYTTGQTWPLGQRLAEPYRGRA